MRLQPASKSASVEQKAELASGTTSDPRGRAALTQELHARCMARRAVDPVPSAWSMRRGIQLFEAI